MNYFLSKLSTKEEVDRAIIDVEDKVVVLRFGRESDSICMNLDKILTKCEVLLKNMATIYTVDVDEIPEYTKYFDITLIPSTVFFFNTFHLKCDYGTQDHTKWIGTFVTKQDFINLVETFYRGAMKGKVNVQSPITDPSHIPKYQLLYKDI